MTILMISRSSLNLGHVQSRSRSQGQILKNFCLHSNSHILDSNLFKLDQNDCLDDSLVKYESGSCGVKNGVIRPDIRKILFTL
jgi:hypothetical protein